MSDRNRARAAREDERNARAEQMGQRASEAAEQKTKAPLIVGAVAFLVVLAVVIWSWVKPGDYLTVDSLSSPVVAAHNAGDALYPPNTEHALQEVIKFGYLPEVPLATTADGDIVLADQDDPGSMGLSAPVGELSTSDFLDTEVPSPEIQGYTSKPLTWESALDEFGTSTVFIASVADPQIVTGMKDAVDSHSHADAIIVRSESAEVLQAAEQAGYATLEAQTDGMPAADELASLGVDMVEAPAESVSDYADAGLKVWATGIEKPEDLTAVADQGAFGAISSNPFVIQPSAVKTD